MIQFKHTRVYLTGPHLGPLRTTLWSWSPGRRRRTPPRVVIIRPHRRRIWPQVSAVLLLIGAVSKAYQASVLLGVLITVLLAGVVAVAVHALVGRAAQQARGVKS